MAIDVEGIGVVRGDIAWGGNWFFRVDWDRAPIDLQHVEQLTEVAWKIRQAVNQQGYPEIDHIELFGKPSSSSAHSKNFVLCPGKAYDRSPCGTGTSAKLACLAADGKLEAGQTWIQESIINSTFEGSFHWIDRTQHHISPEISGEAHVISDAQLILSEQDPFCWGIH
ncbi:MAG: proline racemase family protein [Pirellulales bacterium]